MEVEEPERVLCFNVLLDESRKDVGVFRHPLYSYSECLAWPPANWRAVACWHCCHTFDEEPVPLPQAYDRKKDRFSVFGVFCSWPCAKQYQNEHQTWTSGERVLLLEEMAREAFGYEGPPIQAAPPRHRLIMFGGDLSIDAFRQEHGYLNATLRPPLLSFPEIYERVASAGCEGDTAPVQWSVRGIRAKEGTKAAAMAAAQALSPSPYDSFISKRKETLGLSSAPSPSPSTHPTHQRGTVKRFPPGAEARGSTNGSLEMFLRQKDSR